MCVYINIILFKKIITSFIFVIILIIFFNLLKNIEHNKLHVIFRSQIERQNSPNIHYVEHLAWLNAIKGGRTTSSHSNAWTNNYTVGYWLSSSEGDLTSTLSQLKRVFEPITLDTKFANQERDIILREYETRIADNIDAQAHEAMNAYLYEGNAIAQSVIGTPEEIKALTYEDAKALHAKTHTPDNAILHISGDVPWWQVKWAMWRSGFPELIFNIEDYEASPFVLGDAENRTSEFSKPNAQERTIHRKVVALGEPIPFDLLDAQTALLSDILNANLEGGLAGPLKYDQTIASQFQINIWPIDEQHVEVQFIGSPNSDISLDHLKTAYLKTLRQVAESGTSSKTYDRVLKRFDGYWPDWGDSENVSEWMDSYQLDRLKILREPLSKREVRRLSSQMSRQKNNQILKALAGSGRTATAHIRGE